MELLGRLKGRKFLEHPPEYREVLFAEIRAVVRDHIPETVDHRLGASHRIQMSLVRAERLDLLVTFAEADARVLGRARLRTLEWAGRDVLRVVLDAGMEDGGPSGLGFERAGDGLRLRLPTAFASVVPDDARQVPPPESSPASLTLRRRDDSAELTVPSTSPVRMIDGADGRVTVAYSVDARLAPDQLGAAGLRQDGTWDLVARFGLGGLAREAKVSVDVGTPMSPRGRSSLARRSTFRPYRARPGTLSFRVEVHTGPVGWSHDLRRLAAGVARRLGTRPRLLHRRRA